MWIHFTQPRLLMEWDSDSGDVCPLWSRGANSSLLRRMGGTGWCRDVVLFAADECKWPPLCPAFPTKALSLLICPTCCSGCVWDPSVLNVFLVYPTTRVPACQREQSSSCFQNYWQSPYHLPGIPGLSLCPIGNFSKK